MRSASGDLIPACFVLPLIAGVTIAAVALTLYCLSHGISTVFMHLYYLPIILIAYFYRRRGIPVLTGLSLFYLAIATFFLYPSTIEIGAAVLRAGMFILIGVIVAELSERLEKTKEGHRVAEEYQKSIIDNANVWLTTLDTKGKILAWNRAAEKITGYRAEEVLGQTGIWKFLYPDKDYRRKITRTIARIINEKNYFENFESDILTKDGRTRTISWNTRGLVGAAGTIERYVAIGLDITERKRVEKELQESEEKFRLIVENSHDIIYTLTADGVFTFVSPAWTTLLGHPATEVIGHPFQQFVHPDDIPRCMVFLQYVIRTGQRQEDVEYRVQHTDGTWRWHSSSAVPLKDETGRIIGGEGIARDITERKRIEEALLASEEKFRAFFTTSQDCVFITSMDGHWIDFNNSAVELFGYESRKELMALKIADLYAHPDERNMHMRIISEQGFTKEFPVDLKKKDGTIIHTLVSSVARRDEKGTIIGFQGAVRDITELKRAEKAVQELASVVQYSGELMGIATLEGKITFLNDAGARMIGIQPEDAIGKDFFRFVPDHLKEKVQTEVLPVQTEQGIWSGDLQYKNQKTGNLIDVHAMTFTITDPATGKPQYMANVSLDITDRKRAEEALRTSQHLLTEAMNLAHMAHWELDVPTGIFTLNDRFYALYGTTAEREGGYQMPVEVYAKEFVHPDDMQVVSDETNKAIVATDPDFTRQIEHRIIRRDGEVRHIIVRFGITKDAEGRTVKTHGANQDITDRKRAEDALRQANKQLNLLSNITRHDILNQLMALKGYLELSHDVIDNPSTLIEYIKKEEKAANTIEHQITFTRDYQELGVAAPEWQSVNASIKKAAAGLPMRAVHVEVDPKNPEIFADRLFEKVFYNLIDNALRYGGDQMKTIRFSSEESGTSLTIVCEDDGVGISTEDKTRLFIRGFGKNTGLGLFLSREILSITGITITENGTPGKGARFEIAVPKGMWRTA